jgi:predicted ATP-grasp superfamily ATP-dependent carboligase/O-antigen/teichoic acid export membrane protein
VQEEVGLVTLVARGSASQAPEADFDRSVPVVLLKIGRYPLHHGGVGAIRSLGRVGVSVYAIIEDALTPAALSRYAKGTVIWPTSGREPQEWLVEGLAAVGRQVGERSVLLCTDDEAAVLVAEHVEVLSEWFILPPVPPDLPRRLTSKRALGALCEEIGIPSPRIAAPRTAEALEAFIEEAVYPVVAKNDAAWTRLSAPAVQASTVVRSPAELRKMATLWVPPYWVALQEYIPSDAAEDWFCQAWVGADAGSTVLFTGVKLRQWPPEAGVTSYAQTVDNPELTALSTDVFRILGYRGIADLDWRFDRRDGRYKLLDFNPRMGAQFRVFETDTGIDVVRAAHLDLTGRPIPAGHPIVGRSMTVEHLDVFSRLSRRPRAEVPSSVVTSKRRGSRTLAWFAKDDPLPFVAMLVRATRMIGARLRPRRGTPSPSEVPPDVPPEPVLRQRKRSAAERTSFRSEFGMPLFRNGHALVLGAVTTGVIGMLFWVLAARRASPSIVGRNIVAINVLTSIGAVAQLNLQSALIRFVQPAGRHTRRLVVGVYLVSAVVALVLAGVFLILLPRVAPQLAFLRSSPGMATWFVAAAAIWSIMILEDGVLTGLRKTPWVPVENGGFSLLKVGMVVPFIALFPVAGIFLSWTVAALATVVPTNVYLFARAITQHQRSAGDSGGVTIRELGSYVPYDFLGNLWWQGLILVLPLIVLIQSGAATSAYFSLAWLMAGLIYLVPLAIGDSLVVELSIDASDFEARCKQVMVHLLKILVPGVVLLVVAAPWVLGIFGTSYAASGTNVLRLLGLSALPFIVTGTAVSAARGQRRTRQAMAVFAGLFVLIVPLGFGLLAVAGINGMALAVLIGQAAMAAILLMARHSWMRGPVVAGEHSAPLAEVPKVERPRR